MDKSAQAGTAEHLPEGPASGDFASLPSFTGQVGGHAASIRSFTDPDSRTAWIVKDCLSSEVEFYQQLNQQGSLPEESAEHAYWRRKLAEEWTPTFRGTWPVESDAVTGERSRIVLQDLLSPFEHPNVLDVKLGTQLWDDRTATEEKRARMDKASQSTTSAEVGLRLTGFKTWSAESQRYIVVDKAFGKTVKADQLHLGVKAFLGLLQQGDSDLTSYLSIRKSLTSAPLDDIVPEQIRQSITQLLTESVLPALDQLIDLLGHVELRIRGGSVLVVYEGEPAKVGQTLHHSGSSSPSPAPCCLRLIDFAHAYFCPGKGPDRGVLKGLTALRRLLADEAETR